MEHTFLEHATIYNGLLTNFSDFEPWWKIEVFCAVNLYRQVLDPTQPPVKGHRVSFPEVNLRLILSSPIPVIPVFVFVACYMENVPFNMPFYFL